MKADIKYMYVEAVPEMEISNNLDFFLLFEAEIREKKSFFPSTRTFQ